jgi:hypothetical protein
MADMSDVEAALVALIAGALFPGVTYLPGAATASVPAGLTVSVYRGYPEADSLDPLLTAGQAVVSIFTQPNASRDTTRYPRLPLQTAVGTVTLTAQVNGAQVFFGGTGGAGQVVGVFTGGFGYAYRLLANDTPTSVAAALVAGNATIPGIPGATASGGVLTLPSDLNLAAAVVADVTTLIELWRQTQIFLAIIWAPTPAARDTLATLIAPAIALAENVALPDGSQVKQFIPRGTVTDDVVQKDNLWKRTLRYEGEYATTLTQVNACALFGYAVVLTSQGTVLTFGDPPPPTGIIPDQNGNIIVDGAGAIAVI